MEDGMAPQDAQSRPRAKHYLLQSALAFVFLAGLIFLLHYAGRMLEQQLKVVASLASTAFVVFALHRRSRRGCGTSSAGT